MTEINLDMEFQMPKNQSSQIKVMGIGGGGSNAVNYMFENGIKGVDFVICNTDAQALEASLVPTKIQLGINLTEGLGAGANPDVGKRAAEESSDRITELLDSNTKMLFITAGMGGGTGTGAAPIIAEIAQQKDILTVGVVTVPFATEGGFRRKYADEGILELKKFVDTLLVIDNEKLIEVYGDLTFTAAFAKANEVLNTATKGIAEVISQHLLVNIDLNDARKVLENSGTAVMGQAKVEGDNRAIEAVVQALDSPLLNDNDITGAKQVLLKIVTGDGEGEIKMSELAKIKNKIQQAAGTNVNIIEGIGIDPDLGMSISVTVIATGFEEKRKPKGKRIIELEQDYKKIDSSAVEPKEAIINPTLTENDLGHQTSLLDNENTFDLNTLDNESIEETEDQELEGNIEEAGDPSCNPSVISDSQSIPNNKIVLDLTDSIDDFCNEAPSDDFLDLDHSKNIEIEKEQNNTNDVSSSNSDPNVINNEESKEETITLKLEDDQEIIREEEILDTIDNVEINTDAMKVQAREREQRLRTISMQLRTPSGLTSLEDVPAYKRNNIELTKTSHSSESEISSFTLTNKNESRTELRQDNSFLHDNID
ncbi:MAG: cell division protein FtsZ [Flavobacteriales bacterium]|nr:cell division protein FtsZ [Flavobacteriales bacterium]